MWPLHTSEALAPLLVALAHIQWPLHPFLFTGNVALAHGPCTSSHGPCTGPCLEKMLLFGRMSVFIDIWPS